ncbi:MAG: conjugal transfer protein MobC [Chitinophagaceae bacterium]
MNTGENEQALRKIRDLTRLGSFLLLLFHFYLTCHPTIRRWGYTFPILDHLVIPLRNSRLFARVGATKAAILLLFILSLPGVGLKKMKAPKNQMIFCLLFFGVTLFFGNFPLLVPKGFQPNCTVAYLVTTMLGFLSILQGLSLVGRGLPEGFPGKVFNEDKETFPQEERRLPSPYGVNLRSRYRFEGKWRDSWINILHPFRGLMVLGTPGSGKSYFVIRQVITQQLDKGMCLFLYDFKYPDLTQIAYHQLARKPSIGHPQPQFYVIDPREPQKSHRCNPLDPDTLLDLTDALEASRTILLGLNRDWIRKQGEFFVESPINFVAAIIWFLKQYRKGKFCTLPHVIELMQTDYSWLFPILRTEPEVEILVDPFVSAYLQDAREQLEGQVASAKIAMGRLSSPEIYYLLSGNDFTLDINNPQAPKVVCLGNHTQRQQIYGAVLSLYISRVIKLVNRKNQLPCSLILDEFPTIYCNGMDSLLATARENRVATTLCIQDYSQLKKDYGREQAEVIFNLVGNVISGQVLGETARQLSERFGKIIQQRQSYSVNSTDTSYGRSTLLEAAIPPSRMATLSAGEFVGMVGDDPHQRLERKLFHAQILQDHQAISQEMSSYQPLPQVRAIPAQAIGENYLRIRTEVRELVATEMQKIKTLPALRHLLGDQKRAGRATQKSSGPPRED